MSKVRRIALSARMNFTKIKTSPRLYALIAVILCFYGLNLHGLSRAAQDYGLEVTPWVFPHFFSGGIMTLLYSYFTIMLFCDAPFTDSQTSFCLARTGRMEWILGQIVYIVLMSLLYTLFLAFAPILVLLPDLSFSSGWGTALKALTTNNFLVSQYQIVLPVDSAFLQVMQPLKAMLLTMLLTWLGSMFIGAVMMAGNLFINEYAGPIAAGTLAFLSYFSVYMGNMFVGDIMYWLAPMNWTTIYALDWAKDGRLPSLAYALSIYIVSIVLLFGASTVGFCRKDVRIRQGGIIQ